MEKKRALITGLTGQDGSYLAEHLLSLDYEVHGVVRRSSSYNLDRLRKSKGSITIHDGDLTDQSSIDRIVVNIAPNEIYNLGAQSHVKFSFETPVATGDVTGLGFMRILEAARNMDPTIRIYQAASSEMFGSAPPPQNESTPFHPRSPYGCAKMYAYWAGVNYRESYKMHISNGILFNHESPRRGEDFVTRKITMAAARIYFGLQKELHLGNLDAKRDWGFAGDYVKAMHLMLQQEQGDDYVIASGEAHTVREFCELAFQHFGLDYQKYVKIDQRFYRPAEVDFLLGDASKAHRILGWKPETSFRDLVEIMAQEDENIARIEADAL